MLAWLQTGIMLGYEWLREWQVLVAAALVIWTLRACSREIRRSFHVIADRERTQPSWEPSPDARVEPVVLQPHPKDSTGFIAAPPVERVSTQGDVIARLETLRNAVRHALAEIPAAGGGIGEEGAKLYRKVMLISLDDMSPGQYFDRSSALLLKELRSALTEPQSEPIEAIDGKIAWEWLVRVNKLARSLHATAKAHNTDTV